MPARDRRRVPLPGRRGPRRLARLRRRRHPRRARRRRFFFFGARSTRVVSEERGLPNPRRRVATPPRMPRGYSAAAGRGDAADATRIFRGGGSADATWIFCGGGSRRRRGCHVDIPRRRSGRDALPNRDGAAAATRLVRDTVGRTGRPRGFQGERGLPNRAGTAAATRWKPRRRRGCDAAPRHHREAARPNCRTNAVSRERHFQPTAAPRARRRGSSAAQPRGNNREGVDAAATENARRPRARRRRCGRRARRRRGAGASTSTTPTRTRATRRGCCPRRTCRRPRTRRSSARARACSSRRSPC